MAQDDVEADTLDWRGYFSLSIDNRWQYYKEIDQSFGVTDRWYEQWRVAADTSFGSTTYFIIEVTCESVYAWPGIAVDPCRNHGVQRDFVRYDESGANILALMKPDDGGSEEEPWLGYDFRLDAPFGSTEGFYSYSRAEDSEAVVSDDTVRTTVKEVSVMGAVPGSFTFAHGVGLMVSGFSEGEGSEASCAMRSLAENRTVGDSRSAVRSGRRQPAEVVLMSSRIQPLRSSQWRSSWRRRLPCAS